MSPGCATRLTCADGTRAFVKAVGAELNPDTPGLFRREIGVLDHLGEHELWARLLASYDDGAWVALLIEDVEGRHPDFGDAAELDAVLPAVDRSRSRAAGARRPVDGGPRRRRPRLREVGRQPRHPGRRVRRDAGAGVAAQRPARLGGVLREQAGRPDVAGRALGHPRRQPAAPPGRRDRVRRLGRGRPRTRLGRPVARAAGARRRPVVRHLCRRPPQRLPRSATRPSRPSSPGSARTSRCARWSRSTSTCPRSTISASGSRGGCWRPWPDAPGAERCSTYVGRPPAPRQAIWAPARRGGSVSHCMSGTRPSPC